MSFLKKQIYQSFYFEIETTIGTEIIPSDTIGSPVCHNVSAFLSYLEGTPLHDDEIIPCQLGFIARLSAPGYLDCTSWSAHKTFEEADKFLDEMYGDEGR